MTSRYQLAALQATVAGLPSPVEELRFAPPRRWRFDFAWPSQRVALEVQGGIWTRGRHARGSGLVKEYEKLNTAAALGWRVCYVTPQQMRSGAWVDVIRAALNAPMG